MGVIRVWIVDTAIRREVMGIVPIRSFGGLPLVVISSIRCLVIREF